MRGIISMAAPSETCRTAEPYSDTDEHQGRTPSPASVEAPKTLYVVSDSSFASMGLSLYTERRSDCGAVLQGGRDDPASHFANRRTNMLPIGIQRRTDRFPIPSATQDMTLTGWIQPLTGPCIWQKSHNRTNTPHHAFTERTVRGCLCAARRMIANRNLHDEIDRPIYQMTNHKTDSGNDGYDVLSAQSKQDKRKTGRHCQQQYHNRT